jgi:hypothetical protein
MDSILQQWAKASGVELDQTPSTFRDAVAAQRKLLDLIEQMGTSYEEHITRSKKKKG